MFDIPMATARRQSHFRLSMPSSLCLPESPTDSSKGKRLRQRRQACRKRSIRGLEFPQSRRPSSREEGPEEFRKSCGRSLRFWIQHCPSLYPQRPFRRAFGRFPVCISTMQRPLRPCPPDLDPCSRTRTSHFRRDARAQQSGSPNRPQCPDRLSLLALPHSVWRNRNSHSRNRADINQALSRNSS